MGNLFTENAMDKVREALSSTTGNQGIVSNMVNPTTSEPLPGGLLLAGAGWRRPQTAPTPTASIGKEPIVPPMVTNPVVPPEKAAPRIPITAAPRRRTRRNRAASPFGVAPGSTNIY